MPATLADAEDVLSRVQEAFSGVEADIRSLLEKHRTEVDQLRGALELIKEGCNLPNSPSLDEEVENIRKPAALNGNAARQGNGTTTEDLEAAAEAPPKRHLHVWGEKQGKITFDGVMPTQSCRSSSAPSKETTTGKRRTDRDEFRKRMLDALTSSTGDHSDLQQSLKSMQRAAILPDASEMREKVRDAISKPEYNVANYYKTTGWCQHIARSHWFEPVTLLVIAFNAIWLAIDMDFNDATMITDADPIFQVMEHLFCTFFVGEWLIRFCSFRQKHDALRDFWFVFDTILVLFFALDTWFFTLMNLLLALENRISFGSASILRLVRLVRLNRMGRLVRIVRALPEMLVVIRGIVVAIRSVFFTLCLLLVILFVFGVAFRSLTAGTVLEDKYFPHVPGTMLSLLLGGIMAEYEDTARSIGQSSILAGLLFGVFMFVATITLMNFLVGVLVEAVRSVSIAEKEQLMVKYVKSNLLELLENSGIDEDKNHRLSRSEYETMLLNPQTAKAMQAMGVDVVGLVDFGEVLFADGDELDFPDFIRLVLQLRGTNPTTVKDIVDLRKFFMQELHEIEEHLSTMIVTTMAKSESTKRILKSRSARALTGSNTIDKMLISGAT